MTLQLEQINYILTYQKWSDSKIGTVNTVGTKFLANATKLNGFSNWSKNSSFCSSRCWINKTETADAKAALTDAKYLWKGTNLTITNKKIKLDGVDKITKVGAADDKAHTSQGVLAFYDTDDHKLKLYFLTLRT